MKKSEQFILKICSLNNDAFTPDPTVELVNILRQVANRIERMENDEYLRYFQTILDSNGNDVGRFAIKPSDYK